MTDQELSEKEIVEAYGVAYTQELSDAIEFLSGPDRPVYLINFVQNNLNMVACNEQYPFPVGWDFNEILDAAEDYRQTLALRKTLADAGIAEDGSDSYITSKSWD